MFLSELHDLLPPKLFSKHLGEAVLGLLKKVDHPDLTFGDIRLRGRNPTVLYFVTLGGDVEDGEADPEVKAYMKQMKTTALKAFKDAGIQAPDVKVSYGTDMGGESEITTTCTWRWAPPDPELDAAIIQAALGNEYEVELDL